MQNLIDSGQPKYHQTGEKKKRKRKKELNRLVGTEYADLTLLQGTESQN
jgi:hypothetical protein